MVKELPGSSPSPMNRLIEIAAMVLGGASLFTVCFVAFVTLSGRPIHEVAVIGKLFPAPEEGREERAVEGEGPEGQETAPRNLSDAAVVEASLGLLSAWTLPSPYSTSELRVLSEELKEKRAELEERERSLGRRERTVQEQERGLEERARSLEELRALLEQDEEELLAREQTLARGESAASAAEDARWAEVGRVLEGLEDEQAGKRLLEYTPQEAARVLAGMEDEQRAGEILNQVQGARWKEYVDAYTAAKARAPSRRK